MQYKMKRSRNFILITVADFIARSAYQMGKTPLLPIFAAALGATGAFLGLIVSASTLTGMVLKPLIGTLSDRSGRRRWLIVGTLLFASMPFLYRFVNSPEALFSIRIVHGLATAVYGPVTLAFVAEQNREHCAEKLGWFGMARSAGYVIGPAVGGWLLLSLEPTPVFTIIGLLSSLTFVPVFLLPETAVSPTTIRPPLSLQFKQAFKSANKTAVWFSGGLEATVFIALYAIKAFLPIYALSVGLNVALVGTFFALQEATHMLLKPLGGRLGDRLGHVPMISLGVFILGVIFPLMPWVEETASLIGLALLIGSGQALIFPSTVALVANQVETNHLGAGMGFIGTLKNGGKVLGPVLGGLLIEWFDYTLMFRLMGLFLLLILAAMWVRKSQQSGIWLRSDKSRGSLVPIPLERQTEIEG